MIETIADLQARPLTDATILREDCQHTAELLRSGDELTVRATLSNNRNIILAALDIVGHDGGLHRFHNALRVLLNIDLHDLREAGIEIDGPAWQAFASNPYRWFIRASDADAEKVWAIIEGRQPKIPAPE